VFIKIEADAKLVTICRLDFALVAP